jgi:hypothetical protein
MKLNVNIYPLHLLTSIASGFVAYTIAQGTAQKYINFAAPENEMGCFVIAAGMAIIALICSFEKVKK